MLETGELCEQVHRCSAQNSEQGGSAWRAEDSRKLRKQGQGGGGEDTDTTWAQSEPVAI